METRGVWSGRSVVMFIVLVLGAGAVRAQNLYVLTCANGSGVNVYARDGTLLKKLIPMGGAACMAMAVDKAGRIYVGVAGGFNNVRIFEPDGKQVGSWNVGIGVAGLAIGPDGKIYVAGGHNGKVVIKNFNPDHSPGGLVITTEIWDAIKGIAVDSSGNIYLATEGGVTRYDRTGKPIGRMFGVPHDYPACVAVGPDGNYYSGWQVAVARFSPDGVQLQPSLVIPLAGVHPRPTAITVGKDGRIYVGYYSIGFNRGVVAVFEPSGKLSGKAIMTGEGVKGIYVQE
jgi:hypothetical protein